MYVANNRSASCSPHIPILIFIITIGVVLPTLADDSKCFEDFKAGLLGQEGGVDIHGNPVNITAAVGFTYNLCVECSGNSSTPFDGSTFVQEFGSWLLPWLALISQLPFGAKYRIDNFMVVLLAVGSPTLAAYSLALTVLNGRWIAKRFEGISYPNAHLARRLLSTLQQAPLKIAQDDTMLASLVVLVENDGWWKELTEWLDYPHTWTIPAAASVAWVSIAYLFTVIDAFINLQPNPNPELSDGQAVGTAWLWLLPVVVGWLQISPRCDNMRLEKAFGRSNRLAYAATGDGPRRVDELPDAHAITLRNEGRGAAHDDELCSAPIFNYARFLPWTQDVERVIFAFRAASGKAEKQVPVDNSTNWHPRGDNDVLVHADNRLGNAEQVVAYCISNDIERSHWRPSVLNRFLVASLVALWLQWGTAGAAIIILWFTPTVGLGCHSLSYLLYAAASTIVWMLLVASSALAHYSTLSPESHPPPTHLKTIKWLAVVLRRLGKLLASLNAAWIVVACILQFSNIYDNCCCNSSVLGLGDRAYDVILISAGDVKQPWIAGVALATVCALAFVGFVNLFMDTNQ
jgi:hypothetical protein